MVDTPQPATAGETGGLSRESDYRAAADVFKQSLGQATEPPEEDRRNARGQFTREDGTNRLDDQSDEIEAAEEGEAQAEPEAVAESHEEEGAEEAADEAQLAETGLPTSWPAEQAELWKSLPPEAQAFIAKRDGERDAAVNAKFQEAANLRKAHEAEISEAQANRERYAEAADLVLSLVVPQPPPRTMLDINSPDYDPDAYHYRKALHEDTIATLNQHARQRQEIAAQEERKRFDAIQNATRAGFLKSVPDAADQAKAPALFQGLMEYAVGLGTPAEAFQTPTTALEWHVLWKAREYDRLQEAKAKAAAQPKPEPRKAQPAVRPGVATPKSAIEHGQRKKAMDRLAAEGSIDAGAAAFKHLLKGNLS